MNRARRTQMAIVVLALLIAWEVIGRFQLLGPTFPPLTSVLSVLVSPLRRGLFLEATAATARSAALGMVIGSGIAIAVAGTRQSVAATRTGLDRLAALIHAIPQIAIAPVLVIVFGRDNAPLAVASIAAFFPAYAASTRAFAAAQGAHHDLFTVLGGSRLARLRRLEFPAALPGLTDALRLAAPGAVLGSVLGEWFGAPRGIGLLILSSSQNYDIPLLWAAAVLSTLLAMIGFGLFTVLQRAAARRFA